jgi:hypothetical protein
VIAHSCHKMKLQEVNVIAHSCHKMKLQEVNGPCISGYSKQLDPVLLTKVT